MRRAWLIGVATVILSWQAQGDEPKKKYQIVSPRDVGINATGINGRGDSKPGGRPTVQQTAGSGDHCREHLRDREESLGKPGNLSV